MSGDKKIEPGAEGGRSEAPLRGGEAHRGALSTGGRIVLGKIRMPEDYAGIADSEIREAVFSRRSASRSATIPAILSLHSSIRKEARPAV